jgi:hypothetical protein
MFESSLMPVLQNDATLAGLLNTFNSRPAVFANQAPQEAKFIYLVFRITASGDDYAAIKRFNIYVDIFDYGASAANVRAASQRVEDLLDRATLQHANYNSIRIFYFSDGAVPEDDPRSIHHNLMFEARAGRINACKRITTIGE